MAQVSDDGFWQLVDGDWVPTELQVQTIANGANPHFDTIPQTSEQVMIYSSPQSSGASKTLIVIGVVVVGLILTVILAGVLYAWASSLAEDNESSLVGTWTNPEDKLELKDNGDVKESTNTFDTWYTRGGDLYFEDEDYYYKFKYLIVDDILFLVPYDESGDGEIIEEDCIAYLEGNNGESESYFNDRIDQAESNGEFPSWCNP